MGIEKGQVQFTRPVSVRRVRLCSRLDLQQLCRELEHDFGTHFIIIRLTVRSTSFSIKKGPTKDQQQPTVQPLRSKKTPFFIEAQPLHPSGDRCQGRAAGGGTLASSQRRGAHPGAADGGQSGDGR